MHTSSEIQGQLVGAGKSLNKQEKKLGEEKSRTLRPEDGMHMDRLAKQWSMKEIGL